MDSNNQQTVTDNTNPGDKNQGRLLPVKFEGTGSEYFGIWIVNILLILVTLGIYYPWARVRRIRYFASNTEVDGHPLDFIGEGKQLFLGFFLAAIGVIVYSVSQEVLPALSLGLLALYALVWPWLFRAAHRFRLRKTTWRGLNLGFIGSLKGVYLAMGLPLLAYAIFAGLAYLLAPELPESGKELSNDQAGFIGVLVGVAGLLAAILVPLTYYLVKKYQHSNYAYASLRSRFTAKPSGFYWLFAKSALVTLASYIGVFAAIAIVAILAMLAAGISMESGLGDLIGPDLLKGAGIFLFVVGALIMYALVLFVGVIGVSYFQSRLFNLVWNNTQAENVLFAANLSFRKLLKVKVINVILIILTVGLYIPFAHVALARVRVDALSIHSDLDMEAVISDVRSGKTSATAESAADMLDIDVGI